MKPPSVDPQFHKMNWLQRSAESFRYVLLSIEWWVTPNGEARKWMKANVRLAVFLAAPTFMALPIVVVALWELLACVNALTAIAAKLVFLPILTLLCISFVCRVLKR